MTTAKPIVTALLAAGFCLNVAETVRAELPPQYTVWTDFAAIAAIQDIPEKLGVVDRIERIGAGRFSIHSGNCAIVATVVREGAKSPDGRVIVGPSRVVRVDLGEKECKS